MTVTVTANENVIVQHEDEKHFLMQQQKRDEERILEQLWLGRIEIGEMMPLSLSRESSSEGK